MLAQSQKQQEAQKAGAAMSSAGGNSQGWARVCMVCVCAGGTCACKNFFDLFVLFSVSSLSLLYEQQTFLTYKASTYS